MRCSICMATHDKPDFLKNTLRSIFAQPYTDSGEVEVIVVDDRSTGGSTRRVCQSFPVRYIRLEGEPGFKNPAHARNAAYRAATGDVIICQSDDLIHSPGAVVKRLTEELRHGEFLIATVWNVDEDLLPTGLRGYGERCSKIKLLTGRDNPRPLFFLGSLWREDLYAVGGNDEEFTEPCREDVWFADCLINGLKLKPRYVDVLGYHQDHGRPEGLQERAGSSSEVYDRKRRARVWQAASGPWIYENTLPPSRQADSLPVAAVDEG